MKSRKSQISDFAISIIVIAVLILLGVGFFIGEANDRTGRAYAYSSTSDTDTTDSDTEEYYVLGSSSEDPDVTTTTIDECVAETTIVTVSTTTDISSSTTTSTETTETTIPPEKCDVVGDEDKDSKPDCEDSDCSGKDGPGDIPRPGCSGILDTPKCCDLAAVNIYTDNNHCGSCGHKCPEGQTCKTGTCKPGPLKCFVQNVVKGTKAAGGVTKDKICTMIDGKGFDIDCSVFGDPKTVGIKYCFP